ncbi:phosphoglucomutase/phosphomannomutase family protein, partial [Chloroflexota bacterium]
GEESGSYGFRRHIPERDGILSGLYFLDLMLKTNKTPSALIDYLYSKVGPHHYDRVDIEFPAAERGIIQQRIRDNALEAIEGVKVIKFDTEDGFRFVLEDTTWLLIRFSGTEPVLRIYAESDSLGRVGRLLEAGKKLAGV